MKKKKGKMNIPEGWSRRRIGNHVRVQGGNAFKASSYVDRGVPLVRIGNVGKGCFLTDNFVYISEADYLGHELVHLKVNDILIGMTGELGKVARVSHESLPAALNQRVGRVLLKDRIFDPDFLYYLVLSEGFRIKLEKYFTGAAQKNISSSQIESIEIDTPSLPEQKKIAEILGAVDEEIHKTDEIIAATEKLKKGLMQKLFTRGIGHTKFKKTKIGEIPEEWEVVQLKDTAKVERGRFSHRPRNDTSFYGGNIPFIQTSDVVRSKGRIRTYSQTLNTKGLAVSKMFNKGTIVLTIAANIGDTGIIEFDACFPDSLVGITVFKDMESKFLEYFLKTQKGYLNSIATQSAQKNINLKKLYPLLVSKPPVKEQRRIAEILCGIDQKIHFNQEIKNTYVYLKKGLMRDLLNGGVRVVI